MRGISGDKFLFFIAKCRSEPTLQVDSLTSLVESVDVVPEMDKNLFMCKCKGKRFIPAIRNGKTKMVKCPHCKG